MSTQSSSEYNPAATLQEFRRGLIILQEQINAMRPLLWTVIEKSKDLEIKDWGTYRRFRKLSSLINQVHISLCDVDDYSGALKNELL